MILIDADLLVYAKVADFDQHQRARGWLNDRLNGTARVGLPWASLGAFLRLVTNPRVFRAPLGVHDAFAQVRSWLDRPVAWTPEPTDRHAEILGELLGAEGVRGDLVPDAHLASLAIEHGLTLMSTDGDFARFPRLRWENPLSRE
ncbi:MAG: type II toxin-antitoxin system VapC family toxin [Acidimicrobiia bacterium]